MPFTRKFGAAIDNLGCCNLTDLLQFPVKADLANIEERESPGAQTQKADKTFTDPSRSLHPAQVTLHQRVDYA